MNKSSSRLFFLSVLLCLARPHVECLAGDDSPALPKGALKRLGDGRLRVAGENRGFVVLSPTGDILALNDAENRPSVVEPKTAKVLPQFKVLQVSRDPKQPHDRFLVEAFSPDGKRAIVFSIHEMHVMDVASGKFLHDLTDVRLDRGTFAFSGDSKFVAAASRIGQQALVKNMETGKQVAKFRILPTEGVRLALSPDGALLAVCGIVPAGGKVDFKEIDKLNRTVQVWDVAKEKELHRLVVKPGNYASAVCFSPDGKTLATSNDGRAATFQLWDPMSGKELLSFDAEGLENHVNHFLAFSADGKKLASSDTFGRVRLWDVSNGKPLKAERPPLGDVYGLFFLGEKLIVYGTQSRLAWIWDALAGKRLTPSDGHAGQINDLVFVNGGKSLRSASEDGKIIEWDLAKGAQGQPIDLELSDPKRALYVPRHEFMTFSPDGENVAAREWNGLLIWRAATGKKHVQVDIGNREEIARPSFSRDGKQLAVGSRSGLLVVSTADGKEIQSFDPPAKFVGYGFAAFSPDGTQLAATSQVPVIRAWDLKNKKALWKMERSEEGVPTRGIAYSPDGKFVVTFEANEKVLVFRDAGSGKITRRIEVKNRAVGDDIAFSPKGTYLALAGIYDDQGTEHIHVFDAASGKLVHDFSGHKGGIYPIAFAPDESLLASGGADTTILLWRLGKE